MDFSKLNVEFSNMQNTITKYNEIVIDIKQKIKNNDKDISKYEIKIKNIKNIVEKDVSKLILDILKSENIFLKQLIENKEKKDEKIIWCRKKS